MTFTINVTENALASTDGARTFKRASYDLGFTPQNSKHLNTTYSFKPMRWNPPHPGRSLPYSLIPNTTDIYVFALTTVGTKRWIWKIDTHHQIRTIIRTLSTKLKSFSSLKHTLDSERWEFDKNIDPEQHFLRFLIYRSTDVGLLTLLAPQHIFKVPLNSPSQSAKEKHTSCFSMTPSSFRTKSSRVSILSATF